MAIPDTDANNRVEPEPTAALDPSLSPAEGHVEHTHTHTPIPTVEHHHHAPGSAPIDQVDEAPRGVKLATISQTGDRLFRAMASTSGLAIVLLVLFVGIFLLALALPSLQANQDNFFTSRTLREASYALGVPKWKTIVRVVIPTAFAGIVTGIMLGLARVMGETAPLLILVSYAVDINFSPTSDTMGALPTMINAGRDQAPTLPGYERVWAAALTLILISMVLNLAARAIARASKLKEK